MILSAHFDHDRQVLPRLQRRDRYTLLRCGFSAAMAGKPRRDALITAHGDLS